MVKKRKNRFDFFKNIFTLNLKLERHSSINRIKRSTAKILETWNSKKSLHDHCIARHRYNIANPFFPKSNRNGKFFVSARVCDASISLFVVDWRLYELCGNRFVRSTIKKRKNLLFQNSRSKARITRLVKVRFASFQIYLYRITLSMDWLFDRKFLFRRKT